MRVSVAEELSKVVDDFRNKEVQVLYDIRVSLNSILSQIRQAIEIEEVNGDS